MRTGCFLGGVIAALFIANVVKAEVQQAELSRIQSEKPAIAIIIDDIGHRRTDSARAVALPGPIACAVLPLTPHGYSMALEAKALGKEVMLHLPLEATSNNDLLGPGAISLDDTVAAFRRTFKDNLASVPHVVGINNHMGSLLTRHPGHMRWLMQAMQNEDDLFFVDSLTTEHSIAYQIARELEIPAIRRDVFLDRERTVSGVKKQFEELKRVALERGYAVAIGHPFPETLNVLEAELPRLKRSGFRMISVKEAIAMAEQRRREMELPLPNMPKPDAHDPEHPKLGVVEAVAK